MPAFDRVQLVPGTPQIFKVALTTNWLQLPRIPGGIYTAQLSHDPANSVSIYIATSAAPGGNYRTLESAEELGLELDNLNRLWARAASSTATLEVVVQKGQIGADV